MSLGIAKRKIKGMSHGAYVRYGALNIDSGITIARFRSARTSEEVSRRWNIEPANNGGKREGQSL